MRPKRAALPKLQQLPRTLFVRGKQRAVSYAASPDFMYQAMTENYANRVFRSRLRRR